jgi:hypothetical protein
MANVTVTFKDGTNHTYQGVPDGVTPDDVEARAAKEFGKSVTSLSKGDVAAPAPAPKPQDRTFLSTLGEAASNLPGDAVRAIQGVQSTAKLADPLNAGNVIRGGAQAAMGLTDKIAEVLGGGIQHIRDLSSPGSRGDAPAMGTTAFDKTVQGVHDNYLTKQGIYKQVAEHPVGTALAAASVVEPALRATGAGAKIADAVGTAAGGLASRVPTPVVDTLKTLTTAGRRAKAAAEGMRGEATAQVTDEARAAQEAADAARLRQNKAETLAATARTQRGTLDARRAAAAADATPPDLNVGTPASLTDIGTSVRAPAMAQESALNAQMRAADDKYRSAMQAVTAEREAKGVGVSDTPLAKALIKNSEAVVEPNPVKRPTVGREPMSSDGAKLHQEALDVLRPQQVELTDKEARAAAKAGIEVKTAPDGTLYRVVKPSFENVDNFRKKVGQVLSGDVEGYKTVNRDTATKLYNGLSNVLEQYTRGTSPAVQKAWREAKAGLAPFERVRAGKAVVGVQGGTAAPSVPAANIPGRIVAGGRDTVGQVAAVAGDAPVKAAVRSIVQNKLAGKSAADAASAVAPGTTLHDIVTGDSDLHAAVQDYLTRQQKAATAGQQAKDLASRVKTSGNRASALDKAAEALNGTADKAAATARQREADLASLSIAKPHEVGAQYVKMLERAQAEGRISADEYKAGLQRAKSAEQDFKFKATRDKWLAAAAASMGVAKLGMSGAKLLHPGS